MEIVYSRVLDGEYVVNVHLYNIRSLTGPIPVRIIVSARANDTAPMRQLFYVDDELRAQGQELTIAHFTIRNGELMRTSMNRVYEPLRSAKP